MNEDNVTELDLPRLRQAYRELRYEGPEPDFAAMVARPSRPVWLVPAAAAASLAVLVTFALAFMPQYTRDQASGEPVEWTVARDVTVPQASGLGSVGAKVRESLATINKTGPAVQGFARPQRPTTLTLSPAPRWSAPGNADVG
jgi:hypothetical protein